MFKVKIISFNSVVYDDFAEKVLFNVVNEGQFCILNHHIDAEFKVVPSICYVFTKNKKFEFYIGYGFATMIANEFKLTSNIVTSAKNYALECEKFGDYGKLCLENFEKVRL